MRLTAFRYTLSQLPYKAGTICPILQMKKTRHRDRHKVTSQKSHTVNQVANSRAHALNSIRTSRTRVSPKYKVDCLCCACVAGISRLFLVPSGLSLKMPGQAPAAAAAHRHYYEIWQSSCCRVLNALGSLTCRLCNSGGKLASPAHVQK